MAVSKRLVVRWGVKLHRGKSKQQVQRKKKVAGWQWRNLQFVPARSGVTTLPAARGPPRESLGVAQ
jgi:hypothetical protein